jgi:carotenoid cleavage dioxygenase-like enzyme
LRNGPAKFSVDKQRVASNFDGAAMLHAFEFASGKVLYSNRFLRTEEYYIMTAAKSLNFAGFAQDPCPVVFKNQTSHFIPKEAQNIPNADVSIQEYADKMVALTEIPLPVMFDPKTLETLGIFDYEDYLSKGQWESAHPQHDVISKETVNYYVRFGEKSSYVIWSMADHSAGRKVIAEIPIDFPGYMHSFALTEKYVILVEFPFLVNPLDLISEKKPFIFNYKWLPEKGTAFYVVNRSSGELIAKIKEAPFYCWHHVNAFDSGNEIFVDMATYKNAGSILFYAGASRTKEEIETSQKTRFERFTINLPSQKITREILCPGSLELPRIRSDRTAYEYRYCYSVDADTQFPNSLKEKGVLHKFDVMQKTCKDWSEEGCVPCEPVFVPRPDGLEEDDGVVLSVVLDMIHSRSFLLILDAHNWTEIARAEAPHAIPFGIHGLWNGSDTNSFKGVK